MAEIDPQALTDWLITDAGGDRHRKGEHVCRHLFDSIYTETWWDLMKMYRVLRQRVPYADPGSPELDGSRAEGYSVCENRQAARGHIRRWARALDWACYMGSK